MDSSKFKTLMVIAVAAIFAVYLGVAAATAQFEAIAWIVAALVSVFIFSLGRHVWILIPLSLGLIGGINALPGTPPPWWLATVATGGMLLVRFLMRQGETFHLRLTWLDVGIILQVIAILQAYVRNPTGFSVLGGDVVGGKPYFIFTFAFIAYAMQSIVRTDMKMVRIVALGMICIATADGLLILGSQLVPGIAAIALPIYSATDFNAAQGEEIDVNETRLTGGQDLAKTLGLAAFTLFIPISVFNPTKFIRFTMIMVSLGLVFLSGFRSALGSILIFFVVGSLVRKRYGDLLIGVFGAILALAFLMGSGVSRHLPFGAQRILSVIPFIDVADASRANAENSSEWRYEMWRLVLTTDRYIKNKVLGDGFGYSAAELRAALDSAMGDHRMLGQANQQDVMLAKGSYHGFHVECIRFTGYFGLALALVTMGIFFHYAIKQIRYFKGRPEWGYVLFICVPFLIHPFYYLLIFGSYRNAFPALLAAAGILKVLDNIRANEIRTGRIC